LNEVCAFLLLEPTPSEEIPSCSVIPAETSGIAFVSLLQLCTLAAE
jgi:hypothetical protein